MANTGFFRLTLITATICAVLSVASAQTTPTPPGIKVPVPALYSGTDNILQWYQVLSSDASATPCTALTNALQSTDADGRALTNMTSWVLGKLSGGVSGASVSAFNISVSPADDSTLVLKPLSGGSPLKLKLVHVNASSTIGVTTLILTNSETSPWSLVWMLSTSSNQSSQYYMNIWSSFNSTLGSNAFKNPVTSVTQGSTCTYPPGVSPPYAATDSSKIQGFWYQSKVDLGQTKYQANPACGALQLTLKANSSGLPFLQDFASQQTIGKIGPQYPNWTPLSALNAAITPQSTPGLYNVLFQFPFGNLSAPYSVLAVTVGADGNYDSVIGSNGRNFSSIFFNVRTPMPSQQQLAYFQQFIAANSFWQTVIDVPQPANCYYAQTATPPGIPVPVSALYSGTDNILQWYQVLSSDTSATPCTALTNALQSTDADGRALTPWVLGKLSGGASISAFNISVDSIDNSLLVLSPLSGGSPLRLRLVAVKANETTGVTTLILTNFGAWNLVWMLSTSSNQPSQYYMNIWNAFYANVGAPCANCPKYNFPGTVAPVPQGSNCAYPFGIAPLYKPIQLNMFAGTWFESKIDAISAGNFVCNAVGLTPKTTNNSQFLQEVFSYQLFNQTGPSFPVFNDSGLYLPTSTPGLLQIQTVDGTTVAYKAVIDLSTGSDGLYNYITFTNGPSFSTIIMLTRYAPSAEQNSRLTSFLSANGYYRNIVDVPRPSNCLYVPGTTPNVLPPSPADASTSTPTAIIVGAVLGSVAFVAVAVGGSGISLCTFKTSNAVTALNEI